MRKGSTITPRLPIVSQSGLVTDIQRGGDSNAVSTTLNDSKKKVFKNSMMFQQDLQEYMWGDSSPADIDLTSSSTLALVTSHLKPMLLKRNSHSGVTLILPIKNLSEVRRIDKLMGKYAAVAGMSSVFIYQHSIIDKDQRVSLTGDKLHTGDDIVTALVKDDVLTRKYTDMVSTLSENLATDASYTGAGEEWQDDDTKRRHYVYLKLYPAACAISYPTQRLGIENLSASRLLPVTRGRENPTLLLQKVIAYNTYDTQWFDLYASFFDMWLTTFANRPMNIMIGDYVFKDLMILKSPKMVNNYREVEFFNIGFVSEQTDLSKFVGS